MPKKEQISLRRDFGLDVKSDRDIIREARRRYSCTTQAVNLDIKNNRNEFLKKTLSESEKQALKSSLTKELVQLKSQESEKLDNRCNFLTFFSCSNSTVKAINKFLALLNLDQVTENHKLNKNDLRALNPVDSIYLEKYKAIVKETFARSAAISAKTRDQTIQAIL